MPVQLRHFARQTEVESEQGAKQLRTIFATGFVIPVDVAIDSLGNVYATNQNGNSVSRVGPAGGAATVFATGFNVPRGLAFDILGSGDLYVANMSGSSISRVGPG